jgi:ParB family chromosome partitioning protein
MEHMMAFAVTDDTERQQAAWKALPPGGRSASTLRQLLTESEVSVSRPLAKFVGLEAYQVAGGAIRRDLFAECDEEATYLVDAPLLQRLARAKLDAAAENLRAEAGAWIEVSPRLDFADLATYQHVQTVTRDPTPEEQATLDQIDKERGEIETQLFDLEEASAVGHTDTRDEDDRDAELSPEERKLRDRLDVLDEAENTLRESFEIPDSAQAAVAGTLLSIGRDGELRVINGLLGKTPSKKRTPGALATTMALRLSAHRTLALQAVLADKPKVALATLCHRMVVSTLLHCHDSYKASLRIQVEAPQLENYADDLNGTKAYLALKSRRESWISKLPTDSNLLLPWLLEQPDSTVQELLALCTSISLDAVQSSDDVNSADPIARATALDMSDWWAPTASGYLGKIKKEQILEIVKSTVSPTEAARLEKMKKTDMAKAAEAILADKRWLPAFYKTDHAA